MIADASVDVGGWGGKASTDGCVRTEGGLSTSTASAGSGRGGEQGAESALPDDSGNWSEVDSCGDVRGWGAGCSGPPV